MLSVSRNILDSSSQIKRKMNWSQIATGSMVLNTHQLILSHLPNKESLCFLPY